MYPAGTPTIKRLGRAVVTALLLVAVALSGCMGGGDGAVDTGAPENPLDAIGSLSELVPQGTKTLVTPAGHRVNEYWLAQDPNDDLRIAAAAMDGDDAEGGSVCRIMLTTDGGQSWDDVTPPGFIGPYGQADPWVTIDPSGTLHAACLEWGGNRTDGSTWVLYTRSDDGVEWTEPVSPPRSGFDREIIEATSTGALYYCVTRSDGLGFMVSHDAGDTWTDVKLPDDEETPGAGCHDFVEGPDGTLYLPLGIAGSGGLWRSSDGGATWQWLQHGFESRKHYQEHPACQETGWVQLYCWAVLAIAPVAPMPTWSFAVSPVTGHLFVAFQNLTEEEGVDGTPYYHVELRRSVDRGKTFERVAVPSLADACPDCHSARPIIHVDQQGRLALLWRQAELSTNWTTWFAATGDEGGSWVGPIQLSKTEATHGPWHPANVLPAGPGPVVGPLVSFATDPDASEAGVQRATGFGTEPTWSLRYEGGHYADMSSTRHGFLPCWTDAADSGAPQLWCQTVAAG